MSGKTAKKPSKAVKPTSLRKKKQIRGKIKRQKRRIKKRSERQTESQMQK